MSTILEKKHRESNPETLNMPKTVVRMLASERKSESGQRYQDKPPLSFLMNLPEIRGKVKSKESVNDGSEPMLKSYSSVKLAVSPYHKIESLITTKYNNRIDALKKNTDKKMITISEFNGLEIDNFRNKEQSRKGRNKGRELTRGWEGTNRGKGKEMSNKRGKEMSKGRALKNIGKNHLNRVRD